MAHRSWQANCCTYNNTMSAEFHERLYVVVFVQRGEVMRIISLRKANRREVKLYDEAI
ncbi:MAG: BrnT family toxin [Proteobacteria bacterium]|nr:BrnT family toxin [Pseudomonadota bacterium]